MVESVLCALVTAGYTTDVFRVCEVICVTDLTIGTDGIVEVLVIWEELAIELVVGCIVLDCTRIT